MAQTRKIIKKNNKKNSKSKNKAKNKTKHRPNHKQRNESGKKQTVEQPQQCNSQQKNSVNGNSNKMRKKEKEQMPAYSGPNWEYEFERFLKLEQE